jgi:PAS domain S-box-containing protein
MKKQMIDAKAAVTDIRSGMDDAALMRKYRISAKGLQSLIQKLMAAGILKDTEIRRRSSETQESVIIDLTSFPPPEPEEESETAEQTDINCALIISDHESFTAPIRVILQKNGYKVLSCDQPMSGIDVLTEKKPDVVLKDVTSHIVTDSDLIRLVRDYDQSVPVILLTDREHLKTAYESFEAGASEILVSPFEDLLVTCAVQKASEYRSLVQFKRDHLLVMERKVEETTREMARIIRSKDFLQGIIDSSTMVSVVLTDTDQTVRFWNKGAEKILGYSKDEMIGEKISKIYPPDALTKETVEQLRRMVQTKSGTVHGKMKQLAKNGSIVTISLALSPLLGPNGELEGIVGIGLDVTEEERQTREIIRQNKEIKKQNLEIIRLTDVQELQSDDTTLEVEELSERDELLRGILHSSAQISVILTDFQQNIRYWNKGAENIFGYSEQEITGKKITKIYPQERHELQAIEKLRKRVLENKTTFQEKVAQVAKDGSQLVISLTLSPVVGSDGEITGLVGVGIDVTEDERKSRELAARNEEIVKQSKEIMSLLAEKEDQIEEKTLEIARIAQREEFLKGILNSSTQVSVIQTDPDQVVRFWNKGAENIFGYKRREMMGQSINKLYPPDAFTAETVETLRDLMQSKTGTVHARMKQISKAGEEKVISLAISPMKNALGKFQGIVGIGLDVTEEERQKEAVKRTQDVTIRSLAQLAESRDEETGAHLLRIQEYCRVLCKELSKRDRYKSILSDRFIDDLVRSSVLHDIGKVAIPDAILMSPRKFTQEELAIMKRHTVVGGEALERAVEELGMEATFLSVGRDIAFHHHERWDGDGYPKGLQQNDIPLSARIVALVDVYDALTSERRYKKALSHEEACRMIEEGRGTHFDPDLVDVFKEISDQFLTIRTHYAEEAELEDETELLEVEIIAETTDLDRLGM